MNAEQRQLFEDTMAEDEADLQARLKALQGDADQADTPEPAAKRKPRREKLPEHLRRVEHRHEPTTSPATRPRAASLRCASART